MLRESLINALKQISEILDHVSGLSQEQVDAFYVQAHAGKHVRHVLDHFLAFERAFETGVLNYNLRNRESIIETDVYAAQVQCSGILKRLGMLSFDNDHSLRVISEINVRDVENLTCQSRASREILYLINHTIHHAAYIGLAPATVTYLRQAS